VGSLHVEYAGGGESNTRFYSYLHVFFRHFSFPVWECLPAGKAWVNPSDVLPNREKKRDCVCLECIPLEYVRVTVI